MIRLAATYPSLVKIRSVLVIRFLFKAQLNQNWIQNANAS